jgi:chromatin remodeling complex protein RSC6
VAEAKGLKKPVKLKADLAEFCGVSKLPRTEITKKLWDYIKAKKLQTHKFHQQVGQPYRSAQD